MTEQNVNALIYCITIIFILYFVFRFFAEGEKKDVCERIEKLRLIINNDNLGWKTETTTFVSPKNNKKRGKKCNRKFKK